jgi:hypothetical protein
MIEELDRVETLAPREGFPAGSRGTVIHVFTRPEPAYEVNSLHPTAEPQRHSCRICGQRCENSPSANSGMGSLGATRS